MKSPLSVYRCVATVVFVFSVFSCVAQVRFGKLVIKTRESFVLQHSDILVVDTLVMMDSSSIVLNPLKNDNYIRATVFQVGKSCSIIGNGRAGTKGGDGLKGVTPGGPCQPGTPGRNGMRGLDGTPAINLFLYIDQLKSFGSLTIQLTGGNGGDGGNGGPGGGGGSGTKHCLGGNGANGGHGGNGGNGGNGGTVRLGGQNQYLLRNYINNGLTIRNGGGTFGYGGTSGYGGPAGLGPKGKDGKAGARGRDGTHGRPGNIGTILFEQNN